MKTHIPDNCGNSPRSLMAIEIAVGLAASKYQDISQFLADDFEWSFPGSGEAITGAKLEAYMLERSQSGRQVDRLEIQTSISHGKYAAVSGRAHRADGSAYSYHDLYEFTGASSSAKLRKVTSYIASSET